MERLFFIIQISTITVFFIIGSILYKMGTADLLLDKRQYDVVQTTFVMEEERQEQKKKEEKKPKAEEKKAEEVVPAEEIVEKEPEPEPEPEVLEMPPDEPPPPPEPPKQRQVYGLRRVYSQGLGAGGGGGDAIVGKRGNTLNKAFDTLTATDDDLRKRQEQEPPPQPTVSAAAVTQFPRLKSGFRSRRPQYSKEMLENRVEGVVKARILIGADGKVQKVEIQSDIGYDSAEIAEQFLMTLEFDPAMRGEESVAVWIPFSIRFELL